MTCLRPHSLRWSTAVPCSEPKPRLSLVGCSSKGPFPPEHQGAVDMQNLLSFFSLILWKNNSKVWGRGGR